MIFNIGTDGMILYTPTIFSNIGTYIITGETVQVVGRDLLLTMRFRSGKPIFRCHHPVLSSRHPFCHHYLPI